MRVEIQGPASVNASGECRLRALLFNDAYEPVAVKRTAFFGPSLAGHPEAVEPSDGTPEEFLILRPFTFYGRERVYHHLPPGDVAVSAYYEDEAAGARISETHTLRVLAR